VFAGLGLVVASLALPTAAVADKGEGVSASKSQTPSRRHREGEYGGATPGVVHPYADEEQKKRFRRPKPRRKNALYWLGFQSQADGSARIFAQLTRDAEYSQRLEGNVLVVHIAGVRHLSRNTIRRIDTRFFASAVQEVKSKRVRRRRARKGKPARKAGIEIYVTFKNPVDAREASASLQKEKDEFYYLYLDFSPATALPEEADKKSGAE
jgi:hypothetical protein